MFFLWTQVKPHTYAFRPEDIFRLDLTLFLSNDMIRSKTRTSQKRPCGPQVLHKTNDQIIQGLKAYNDSRPESLP